MALCKHHCVEKCVLARTAIKLKVGVLIDDFVVDDYSHALLQGMHTRGWTIVGITGYKEKNLDSLHKRVIEKISRIGLIGAAFYYSSIFLSTVLQKYIYIVERRIVLREFPQLEKKYNIENLLSRSINVSANWSKSKLVCRFTEESVKTVESEALDILIRLGSGILRGEILNAASHGVISLHHGDNRYYRGGPCGFWEVLENCAETGYVIQILSDRLDGGDIVYRQSLMTRELWHLNSLQVQKKSISYLLRVLDHLNQYGQLPRLDPNISFSHRHLYKVNGVYWPFLMYILRVHLKFFIRSLLNKLSGAWYTDWEIAFSRSSDLNGGWSDLITIPNSPGSFNADPFVINYRGRTVCFFEEFLFNKSKGVISAFELDKDQAVPLGRILEEPWHLSYPFVFEHDGQLYMLPEAQESGKLTLYKCAEFPMQWEPVTTLMNDVSIADASLHYINQSWYLIANESSEDYTEHNSELHVYRSSKLIDGRWHHLNSGFPFVSESTCARNGGLFNYKGELIRVSQNHGINQYGKGMSFNQIIQIDEERFHERRLYSIDSDDINGFVGCHHLHFNGEYVVIDRARRKKRPKIC